MGSICQSAVVVVAGKAATVVLAVLGEGNVAQEDVSTVVLVAIVVVAVVVDSAEIVQADFAMAKAMAEAMAVEGIRSMMMEVVKESCGAANDGCIIFFGGEVGEQGEFESRIK
jgi:hypothetical protein